VFARMVDRRSVERALGRLGIGVGLLGVGKDELQAGKEDGGIQFLGRMAG
jgi:hypothetical protein